MLEKLMFTDKDLIPENIQLKHTPPPPDQLKVKYRLIDLVKKN
jgi:hypothetical protein